jgi:tetratricopeptide (TPR) repeat protein
LEEEELEKANYEDIPIETTPVLDESVLLSRLEGRLSEESFCPLCSKVLTDPDTNRCPHCGADIKSAREAIRLSKEIIAGIERAFRQGDFEGAEEGLEQLDQINLGQVPRGTYLRAKMYFHDKDYAKAIAIANSLLETIEDDDSLRVDILEELPIWQNELRKKLESQEHYNFALSRIRDGYFEEAYDHLLKAIELAPHLPENFKLLGKVCLKLRDYENGRYYLERAILIDSDDQPALELLAKLDQAERLETIKVAKRRFFLSLSLFFSSAVLIGLIIAIFFVFPNLGK